MAVFDDPPWYTRRVEVLLYVLAAFSYCGLAIFHKFLLNWIIGPIWLVAWVVLVPPAVEQLRSRARR